MVYKLFYFATFIMTLTNNPVISQSIPTKFGKCIVPGVAKEFKPNEFFKGRWYKQKGYGSLFDDMIGVCPTVEYKVTDSGDICSLDYLFNEVLQTYLTKYGHGKMYSSAENLGYLKFTYNMAQGMFQPEFQMYIIDTDYTDWAIVYYCEPTMLIFKTEAAWIMSRSRDGIQSDEKDILSAINKNGLNYNDFVNETNKGCGIIEPHL